MENTWMDVASSPDELGRLIDIMVDINLHAIERFARAGADAFMWFDDWGLQDGLMVSPRSWREIWKPRYAKVFGAVHDAGLFTFLHSCGDITSILNDLIEIGLDVIQMDQQENMGLERLGREFGGRITFWSPVDIQATMANGSLDNIRAYCRNMVTTLGRPNGGFMASWYTDPAGAGHRQEALDAMCREFVRLSSEFGKIGVQQ
jgi:uroporphyrinogen-III decarboxylase